MADLVVRNARITGRDGVRVVDIEVSHGVISAIGPEQPAAAIELDAGGRLVVGGLVDTHLHLDKTRLATVSGGGLNEAIAETGRAKARFTVPDVYARGEATLRQCIANGTTKVRAQTEVDPTVELRALEGVQALAQDYRWAVDVQVCAYAQEGLQPGSVELLRKSLSQGADLIGGAPYADADPRGQIDTLFELAREFDVDIDFHADLSDGTEGMQFDYICRKTDEYGYGGRVTLGHMTQLSYLAPERYSTACRILAGAGVAVTVLPSTDLFLTGCAFSHAKPRGVLSLDGLLDLGVKCSIASNNILNAFTPYGDGSLIRMANLYANVCQISSREGLQECFSCITDKAAEVIGADYGIAVGCPADLVAINATDPSAAVAEVAQASWGMKAGRITFTRPQPLIHDAAA